MDTRMTPNPGFHWRMCEGPVIRHAQMHMEPGRRFAVNLLAETDALLLPVPWPTVAADWASEQAQRGDQCGRTGAPVIVRQRAAAALRDREPRLRPLEGWEVAFLLDASAHCCVWRIQREADHLRELRKELLVSAERAGLDQGRLTVVGLPDSPDRGFAAPLCLRHSPRAPRSCGRRRCVERGRNDDADLGDRNTRDAARAWGVFLAPRHSQGEESFAPPWHGWSRTLQLCCESRTRHSGSSQGHELGALTDSQGKARRSCPGGQRRSFVGRQEHRGSQRQEASDRSRRS